MQGSSSEICLTSQLRLPKLPHHNNKSPSKLEHSQRSGLQRILFLRLCQKCSVKMRKSYKRTLNKQRKNFLERKPKKRKRAKKRPSSLEKLQKPKRRDRVGRTKN